MPLLQQATGHRPSRPSSLQRELKQRSGSAHLASGFTIVELMVVMALLGVTLAVGVPAFQQTLQNNRLQTQLFSLRSSLSTARSEAMAQRRDVFVCSSTDQATCSGDNTAWSQGYIAFVDTDNDSSLDPNEEIFLVEQVNMPGVYTVRFRDAGGNQDSETQFSARGDSLGTAGTFSLCDKRGITEARGVIVRPSGQVSVAIDEDSTPDDIVDDLGGTNVTCP